MVNWVCAGDPVSSSQTTEKLTEVLLMNMEHETRKKCQEGGDDDTGA